MRKYLWMPLVSAMVLLVFQIPAQAILFGFDCITDNVAGDAETGEAQFLLMSQTKVTTRNTSATKFYLRSPILDQKLLQSPMSISTTVLSLALHRSTTVNRVYPFPKMLTHPTYLGGNLLVLK